MIYALRNKDNFSELILNNLAQEGQLIRKNYQRRLPSNPSLDYYYMLRETPNTEAVIVEYGFLDNVKDANKLKNNYQNYAEAVIRAVTEYKNLPYKAPNQSNEYIVKAGDTLWTIARKNSLSVDKLKELNNLTSNALTIGQVLKLNAEDIIDNTNYYIVQAGDTLYSIANKYGISVNELKNINNLNSNILTIGQKLLINNSNKEPITEEIPVNVYIVKSGDNLYKIANSLGTTVIDIKNANNLTSNLLSIGQTLKIPTKNEYKTYIVQKGDTLYSIASKYKTTVDNIKVINNLNTNTLSIGQKLLIP